MLDTIHPLFGAIEIKLNDLLKFEDKYKNVDIDKSQFHDVLNTITYYYTVLTNMCGQLEAYGALVSGGPAFEYIWKTFDKVVRTIDEKFQEDYISWFIYENNIEDGLMYNGIKVNNTNDMVQVVYGN